LVTTDAVLRRVAAGKYPWKAGVVDLSSVYDYDQEADNVRDYKTVRRLRKAIDVDVNVRTGVVRFSIEARTPALAKALAESTLTALNTVNVNLRKEQAAAERSFTSERAHNAWEDLQTAERALADFYSRNRSIVNSPTLQLLEGQLKRQVDMAQQVYVQLRMQEEQAALQEVRNTPTISVIDPPLAPVKRSWPKRLLALVLGGSLGLAVALIHINTRP
jgi:uncharacterized protein involved in exopolysaccharide biosynthesis